jgi:hypothetical protein
MRRLLASAIIMVATLTASGAFACPEVQSSAREYLGTLTGTHLYTPRYWNVQAGGSNNLATCPQPGNGWVIYEPDFEFDFQNDRNYGRLEISAVGDCDTVLLVNDAYGQWHFNDDSNGRNPVVNIANAPTGHYDVWVGTYGRDTCPAQLELETWNG